MTGFTTGCVMLANQWENTQVMVKANLVLPGDLIVALLTAFALFLLMGIIQLMAAITCGVDFLGFSVRRVTSFTFKFFMLASQREVGFFVMIKGRLIPPFGGMTILAFLAMGFIVYIVFAMTAITLTRCSAIF